MNKLEGVYLQFKKAVARLEEVLAMEKTDVVRDSAIQRFEIAFDLSWKVIKALLEEFYGVSIKSPKKCFKEAYKQGILDYDTFWIDMTDMRNEIAHTYSEQQADGIYGQLQKAHVYFKKLLEIVDKEIKENSPR